MSKTVSLVNMPKKSILKKRSLSEVILQQSIMSVTFLKKAATAVLSQERRGTPNTKFRTDEYASVPVSSRHMGMVSNSTIASVGSSSPSSQYAEGKCIHFNETVDQCIALDIKTANDYVALRRYDNDDDDDGDVVTNRENSNEPTRRKAKRVTNCKTIAMLPSTTINYGEDSAEPAETAMNPSNIAILSVLPSQAHFCLTKQTTCFDSSEEDDYDYDISVTGSGWRPPPVEAGGA